MKKNIKKLLKSNKGFTIQDLAIAIIVILIFSGVMGSIFLAIFNMQIDTKLDSALTLYAIQALEYIDEIPYTDLEDINTVITNARTTLQMPSRISLQIDATPYEPEENSEDIIKNIKVTVGFTFQGNQRQITMENMKVREF